MTDDFYDDLPAEYADASPEDLAEEASPFREETVWVPKLSKRPLFQTLLAESVDPDDTILVEFVDTVVGPLSEYFAMSAAKGGDFFREKQAEGAFSTERYSRDQTLRAHLVNGLLPARRIARQLRDWSAPKLRRWDEISERLFMAGFVMHDFNKMPSVHTWLEQAGFRPMEAPSERQVPVLESIFREWGSRLGLDVFLEPIGGLEHFLHDVMYIALNTQRLSGTARSPHLLPRKTADIDQYELATKVSTLADLLAYVARTPRELVAHEGINRALKDLTQSLDGPVARLVYHHVAENRGVLLNLIHDTALEKLTNEKRLPLLYAPSGVVYLERADAAPMPSVDELVPQIVMRVRQRAGDEIIHTGKGAKRGNTGLQIDDSYNAFFDLRELILCSPKLVELYIRNNKSQDRISKIVENNFPGADHLAPSLTDVHDARIDCLAEWAALMEVQIRDRFETFDFTAFLLRELDLEDLTATVLALQNEPTIGKVGGGVKLWWFWAAAHAIQRKPGLRDPAAVLEWIQTLAQRLASALPDDLPVTARIEETSWVDLEQYVRRVLTLGGVRALQTVRNGELKHYSNAKVKRGAAICALCGGEYSTRKPSETAVAFQPGVYSARIRIGSSDNKRNLCSICALEQLLRQLFVENLDSGKTAEEQRTRYLAFYPSYFFSPETLRFMRRAYSRLSEIRLSNKELRRALNEKADQLSIKRADGIEVHPLADSHFYQHLDEFLMPMSNSKPSGRIVRFGESAQSTFFMAGWRNLGKEVTDTESWIIPAWLALVLPILLDVKVIVSESSLPLIVETDELAETVWFDGAHAAIRTLVGADRLNIDEVQDVLARLTAAYLIHLDTEYAPPKEQWQRFAPIARDLMESPLYVFHYLKRQERDDHPVGPAQVLRYVGFAESLFSFNQERGLNMSLARTLVEQYRGFYRAKTPLNPNRMRRPIDVVAEALLKADPRLFPDAAALEEVAYGELYRFMERVGKGLADGRFPKGVSASERDEAMREFVKTFVNKVFIDIFRRDVAALRGKQLNLLNSACEVLYRQMQLKEWEERGREADESEEDNNE
jgi:CRISPR-associated protein Csc3